VQTEKGGTCGADPHRRRVGGAGVLGSPLRPLGALDGNVPAFGGVVSYNGGGGGGGGGGSSAHGQKSALGMGDIGSPDMV